MQQGLLLAVGPAARDGRTRFRMNGFLLYELNAIGIDDLKVDSEKGHQWLKVIISQRQSIRLRITPEIDSESTPGAARANLKRRIETVLFGRPPLHLTLPKKAALAVAAYITLAAPLIVGIWNAPPLRAQSQRVPFPSSATKFDVASV